MLIFTVVGSVKVRLAGCPAACFAAVLYFWLREQQVCRCQSSRSSDARAGGLQMPEQQVYRMPIK
jgi:hypothetical protein